jgi:hypothetical protein
MQRRSFLKNSALAAGTFALPLQALTDDIKQVGEKNLIEWRVYHISRNANSKNRLKQYFNNALIPFLKKKNAQIAVFNEYSKNEPVNLYVMLAWPDFAAYLKSINEMQSDAAYLESSQEYNTIPASQAVFNRYETYLLDAFDQFPTVKLPAENKGLYELRLYESATDNAGSRKITMFNKEEIAVFLKTGINPVFFGKIIAGQYMPALLYLVAFNDMAERDSAWAKFGADPDWIAMREKPEYADTVSNIQRIFLTPESL